MSDPIHFAIGTAFKPLEFLAACAMARADYRCEAHDLADCRECETPIQRIEREAMEQAAREWKASKDA